MQGTMPLEEILRLLSIDSDGMTCGGDEDEWTVENAIEKKSIDDSYHQAILKSMKENDINLVPVHIGKAGDVIKDYVKYGAFIPDWMDPGSHLMLGNGNHRVKIAKELGLKEMRYSDNILETGWGGEDTLKILRPDGSEEYRDYSGDD